MKPQEVLALIEQRLEKLKEQQTLGQPQRSNPQQRPQVSNGLQLLRDRAWITPPPLTRYYLGGLTWKSTEKGASQSAGPKRGAEESAERSALGSALLYNLQL